MKTLEFRRQSWPWAILVGAACAGAAFLVRMLAEPLVGEQVPFLTFLPAIMAATYLSDARAGYLALVLSCGLSRFVVLPPPGASAVPELHSIASLAGFFLVGLLLVETVGRVRANQARLEELSDEYGLAIEAGDMGTFKFDIVSGIGMWTPKTAEIFGFPRGKTRATLAEWLALLHPDDRKALEKSYSNRMELDGAISQDYRILRRDGERWLRSEAVVRRGLDGSAHYIIGVLRDITERRATEEALNQLNAILQERVEQRTEERDRLWQMSRDLMGIADAETRFVSVNPAWTDQLGWPREELIGRRALDLVHPDDAQKSAVITGELAAGVPHLEYEVRVRRRDGTYRWISWIAVSSKGLSYAVGRDITEQKHSADQLMKAYEELRAQTHERERAEAELRQMQRLEAVGQLTSGVAHDFNNLLTVILGSLEYLERPRPDPEKVQRRLAMMRSASERGARLTAQLLAFSRRQRLEPKPTDLNDVIRGMGDLLRSTLSGIAELETALRSDLWPALVDRTQLELVILNLAINARDAMEEGGTLRIETANARVEQAPPFHRPEEPEPGEYVVVTVSDNGVGMSAEVLAKAFEPFFTTKEPGRGSGLGLAQVLGFAKQSGGGVTLDSTQRVGTTVRVYLPRAQTVPEAPARGHGQAARATEPARAVLLVDDEPPVREVTAGMLREMGYEVLEAGSGAAALALVDQGAKPDLAVIDFAMPAMNGAELLRRLRGRIGALPAVFITGYADRAALSGIQDAQLVGKPFYSEELAEAIRTIAAPRPTE